MKTRKIIGLFNISRAMYFSDLDTPTDLKFVWCDTRVVVVMNLKEFQMYSHLSLDEHAKLVTI